MTSRRDFLKYTGASALLVASSDVVGELIAQSTAKDPMQSPFKGLSDVALGEAKKAGCSYADIRFTRSVNSGVNANGANASNDRNGAAGEGIGAAFGGRGGRGGGRGGRANRGAAGFGVRVIHSGVWGFA